MKNNKSIRYTILAFVLFAVAIFILLFINGKETRTSEGDTTENISSLYCSTGSIEGAFFAPTSVNTVKNEIKVTFRDEELDKVFYTYTGVYRSNEVAKEDEAVLHAKYNIYFGDNNTASDILSPSFSVINTKFYITLYVDELENLNKVTSQFFFVDEDEIKDYLAYSKEGTKAFYEDRGFKCSVND